MNLMKFKVRCRWPCPTFIRRCLVSHLQRGLHFCFLLRQCRSNRSFVSGHEAQDISRSTIGRRCSWRRQRRRSGQSLQELAWHLVRIKVKKNSSKQQAHKLHTKHATYLFCVTFRLWRLACIHTGAEYHTALAAGPGAEHGFIAAAASGAPRSTAQQQQWRRRWRCGGERLAKVVLHEVAAAAVSGALHCQS